ncbi:hypothetical protein BC834DRAFT_880998 [Gloeopeniophorella convolvens]|nr:hypothetical protein BC834DRAFT_880998 [Gloeopeniophorella convolvens]
MDPTLPSGMLSAPQAATASHLLTSGAAPTFGLATGQAVPCGLVLIHTQVSCPVCDRVFRRASERNRHISDLHLPHHVACTLSPWTGNRGCKLRSHWARYHSGNPAPYASSPLDSPEPYIRRVVDAGKATAFFSNVKCEAELEAAAAAIYMRGFYVG